ncbi:hypothetical protein TNCV_1088571 [Trichonephila clavipes]|uniref:Uncharacterized protein n=1 Tax=Trichonephila clavipes TaxID=2585209 RepID=A0A8X6SP86_TRICX|nr:hypothetical protein TNCV_1088571 [Trichonephila clavipes]
MSQAGGQSVAKPLVFTSPIKPGTHLSTHYRREEGLSGPCPDRGLNLEPVVWKRYTLPLGQWAYLYRNYTFKKNKSICENMNKRVGRTKKNPEGPELSNVVTKVAKFVANLVTKYDANLALSPRSRQVPIESPL